MRRLTLLLLPFVAARAAAAQEPAGLEAALDSIRLRNAWTLDQQASICEIPAPTFKEGPRAEDMARRFRALGIAAVRIDAAGNVIAERPGRRRRPLVVLSAHLDTVFPEGTDVTVHREGAVLRGPGIADDCRGLAVLLVVARALAESDVKTEGTILLVGTVGEEAAGNLRGVRHLVEQEYPGAIDYFLSVDMSGFEVVHRGPGSHRFTVTFSGPGGHSFHDFGRPNPIQAAGRAIAEIAEFEVPAAPRTTFNVGTIHGGTTVNAIPERAAFAVEWRSESAEALASLDRRLHDVLAAALAAERARGAGSPESLRVTLDTIGIRPAGITPDTSIIVRAAFATARRAGGAPTLAIASTDANLPMSLGIPALAIGHGGVGEGEHSLAESYREGPESWRGPQWALLLAVELAGLRKPAPR